MSNMRFDLHEIFKGCNFESFFKQKYQKEIPKFSLQRQNLQLFLLWIINKWSSAGKNPTILKSVIDIFTILWQLLDQKLTKKIIVHESKCSRNIQKSWL